MVGGRRKDARKQDFKKQVSEVLDIFEINIEHAGILRSKMHILNTFYETKYCGVENEIKDKIMALHIDFFGGMDFAVRDSDKNKHLMTQLTSDIREIRKVLNKFE